MTRNHLISNWTIPPSAVCVAFVALACSKGERPSEAPDPDSVPGVRTSPPPGPSPVTPGSTQLACDSPASAATPMRRLSRVEYGYSVHDLFGYTASVSDSLPPEQFGNDGFDNYAQHANIDQLRADKIFGVAENVAASAAAAEVARLPCLTTSSDAACVRRFITTVGRKVYRRPLDEPEIATLEMLYQAGADLSVEARVTNVVHAMLVSPQFIFRAEAAGSSRPVARDPYELATRLSYLLWASVPDEALLAAAASGRLDTKEGIEAEVRRMFADPRTTRGVTRFISQWFDIQQQGDVVRDRALYPNFDAALQDSIREQSRRFMQSVLLDADGSIADLLLSREVEVDAAMAALYQVPHPGDDSWAKVSLPEDQRRGILTHAAWLTKHGFSRLPASFRRGKWMRVRLLCDDLPPPTPDADLSPVALPPGMTNREVLEARIAQSPSCQGCHTSFSDLGFAFENYDSIGGYRTTEANGAPIDASGTLVLSDVDGAFSGAGDLLDRLAGSQKVGRCVSRQVFRYAEGRRATRDDACAIQGLDGESFPSLRELMVNIATSDNFRFTPGQARGG